MNVVVTLDHHYFRTPDGAVWTHGVHAYPFWSRYLSAFDGVKVVARVQDVPRPEPIGAPPTGPGSGSLEYPSIWGPGSTWQNQFGSAARFARR